jgi:small subunit ribosomal protein S7
MSRRRAAEQREVLPDAKYNSQLVTQFINKLMLDGKKSKVERIMHLALEELAKKVNSDAVEAFETVIENVRPQIEVRSRRVGGATYQVPVEVRSKRSVALAMRWLIDAARKRKNARTLEEKLRLEFIEAHGNKGAAIKKREDTHKMAEANRAFAHYRW